MADGKAQITQVAGAQQFDREPVAQSPDEATAFRQALSHLVTLERYYRRALSRRRRALRAYNTMLLLRVDP